MNPGLSTLLGLWNWTSPMWLVAIAAAVLYGRVTGWKWTPRTNWFAAALAAFLLAMISPIDRLAHGYLFSAHMAQHLLLLLIVPGLMLGAVSPAGCDAFLAKHEGLGRFVRFFGSPLVGWFMGTGAMWLWHVPNFCVASQLNAGVGAFQTASLLFMGTCFWWPVFSPSAEMRMGALPSTGYLFTGCVGCTLLGVYLTFSPISVCPSFLNSPDPLGIMPYIRNGMNLTPSADQQVGGLLMWVPACFIYMSAIFANLIRWYSGPNPALAQASSIGKE